MVTLCFHPQQSNPTWADCMCSLIPSDERQLGEGGSYHLYEAKEFTHDGQEAAVTTPSSKNWKHKHCFVCRHRKLLQSIKFGHIRARNLLSTIVAYSFCAFALLGCFYFWKALLAIAVGFLVSSQVPTLEIQRDPGACYGSWLHENTVNHDDFFVVGNLTRTTKYY